MVGNQFLSGHENSEAIGLEFSVLNASQLRYFPVSEFVTQFENQMKAFCYRGSSREWVLSGHENSVAIGLQFSVFNNSQMGQLFGSVFRSTTLAPDGGKMLEVVVGN